MKTLMLMTLGVAMAAAGCGTSASDVDIPEASTSAVAAPVAAAPRPSTARPPAAAAAPTFLEVTLPAGTTLELRLATAVASDTSRVEDAVSADLTRPVSVEGREVLPSGTRVSGVVTVADDSGRVKGLARVAMEFTRLRVDNDSYDLRAEQVSWQAAATKSEDATKIGVGAGIGAAIGGIFGGKKGAAQGAAVGGGAGTGVVLATKGEEIRLASGTHVSTRLTAPLTVRVRN